MENGLSKPNILIVDDDHNSIRTLAKLLKKDYTPMAAMSGWEALDRVFSDDRPHLILLDIVMPEMDGYEVCKRLKSDVRSRDIPVIFITGMSERESEMRGFEVGAVDYITKPFNAASVEARIRTHLELARHRDHLNDLVRMRTRDLEDEIHYRKNVENRLRSSESRLSAIINAFQGFIYTAKVDTPYRIDFMNQYLVDHIGRDGTGSTCYEIIFGLKEPCSMCEIEKVFAGGTVEKAIEHPKSGRWYYAVHSPIMGGEGTVFGKQTILIDITGQKRKEMEIREREAHLRRENLRLKASMKERYRFGPLVGKSMPMQMVYEAILNAAASDASVVIYGESGTGKELVARAIHEHSARSDKEIVAVNCSAVPDNLAENEFFGHRKGAFTGAESDKPGYLKMANGGTLFLDEVGEIGLNLQAKLLRIIEGSGYTPLGGDKILKPDIRIIAATSKNLKDMVKKGLMREEFFYRIHVIPISLPPLRERKVDIPLLVEHFLDAYGPEERPRITGAILDVLQAYDWPGNVRELQNTLHRYATLKELDLIGLDLSESLQETAMHGLTDDMKNLDFQTVLERTEKKLILDALNRNYWRRDETAKSLGITPKTLYRRMRRYGLQK